MPRRSSQVASTTDRSAPGGSIGSRIRDRLEVLGMTRRALALAVGEGDREATIYEWLKDKPQPSIDRLPALSVALQMTIGELLGADEVDPPFAAWQRLRESTEMTDEERRTLASIVWPWDREPTVDGYRAILFALRSGTQPRRQRSTVIARQ